MRAAVLVLPDGAERYDSEQPSLFEEYAIANAHSWYKYYNGPEQGRDYANGSLYLVTGCDKCHCWGNACYSHHTESRSASFRFVATRDSGRNGTSHCNWEGQTDGSIRQQSHQRDASSGATANQTVFMRGYSISVRTQPVIRALGVKKVAVYKSDSKLPRTFRITRGVRAPYAPRSQLGLMPAVIRALGFSGTTRVRRFFSLLFLQVIAKNLITGCGEERYQISQGAEISGRRGGNQCIREDRYSLHDEWARGSEIPWTELEGDYQCFGAVET